MTGREEHKKKIENKIGKMIDGKSDLYSAYVDHCFAEGQQPTTVKAYITAVLSFMNMIQNDCTKESVKNILPMDISKYLNSIKVKENGEATSTSYRATYFSALKSFFNFLKLNRIIEDNPMENMKRPKVTDEVPQDHLDTKQMKAVMNVIRTGYGETSWKRTHAKTMKDRNMAMMALLMETGIRCSALIALDVSNVDLGNKTIIYKDKGEKQFSKPISNGLAEKLGAWLKVRSNMNPKTDALFISEKKNRCSYNAVLNVVKTCTKEAIGVPMSVHKMRHSAITAVYQLSGNDIKYTSKFAGHSNIAITNRYINTDYSDLDTEISSKLGGLF